MDTFSTRDDVIVWMRDMNRYRDWYDRPIPIRYRYRYDPDTISKLCIINQRTVLNSNKRCPRVHSLIVWGIPLLVFFFFFLTSWDTPLPPPCLVGRLVGYPSLSFFMSSVSAESRRVVSPERVWPNRRACVSAPCVWHRGSRPAPTSVSPSPSVLHRPTERIGTWFWGT